ncbi:MAG: 16S rRNA (guanine(527)-N(7))-methyltransferase RsmG [Candidatus Peregrinibacteria bacterium]
MIITAAAAETKLKELVSVFLRENAKINLSAFRTEEQCWIGNILDSLAVMETNVLHNLLPTRNPNLNLSPLKILDLGTGGGFPLLPLALCLPTCSFTGMDATGKKIAAVQRIIAALGLKNCAVIEGRSEELGHDPHLREQFDCVLARAIAPVNVLLEYCAPFAKVGGSVILWKSTAIEEELQQSLLARAELSCHLKEQHRYRLPDPFGERMLVVFEKTFRAAEKYPRAVGMAKKHPLI